MGTAVTEWKDYKEEQPVLGSRCLVAIRGRGIAGAVADCEYHTLETYAMEYGLPFDEDDIHEDFQHPFFVETDDKDEWWSERYIHHWAELYPAPEPT